MVFHWKQNLVKCRKNNVAGDLHGMQTDRVFWVCLSKYHKIHVFRRPLRGPRVKKRWPQMAPEALWPRWCQMVPDGARRSRVCEKWLKVLQNAYSGEWRVCSSLVFIIHPFNNTPELSQKCISLNFRNCTVRVGPHRVCGKLHILLQKPHLESQRVCILPVCVCLFWLFFFDFVLGRGLAMYAFLHVIEQQNWTELNGTELSQLNW